MIAADEIEDFLAGQAIGWYRAGEGAGFIGTIVGALIVLVISGNFCTSQSIKGLTAYAGTVLSLGSLANRSKGGKRRTP